MGWQLGAYGELGILRTHPLMLTVQAPWASSTLYFPQVDGAARPRATTRRLGDVRLSLQTSVLPDGGPVSVAVEAKVPMYDNDSVGRSYGGYERLFPLAGEGQIDLTAWVLGGASLPGNAWLEGAVGYEHRTNWFVGWQDRDELNFQDRMRAWCGGGVALGPSFWMVRAEARVALGPDDGITAESLTLGPSWMIDLAPGIALEPRLAWDAWARNATRGWGVGLGLSTRR